jgi:hypothetical protein
MRAPLSGSGYSTTLGEEELCRKLGDGVRKAA